MYRAYTLQLKPSAAQRVELERLRVLSCEIYNAALQERRDAWRLNRKRLTYIDQQRQLTELRQSDPEYAAVSSEIMREPLRRVNRAFEAFFQRVKSGNPKFGYPRFRSRDRYPSIGWRDIRIKDDRLTVPNLGSIRFKTSRPLIGTPKTATVIHKRGKRWIALVGCDVGVSPEKLPVAKAVGIDVGITALATLSDGTIIKNPRWLRQHENRIASAARSLSRKQKGSNNRLRAKIALGRAYERARNARDNYIHHVSKWIVSEYDLIAFEKLRISNMVHSKLAKSILDAAWGKLIWQISYKAESAGRWAVPVNPRGTSIRCSNCGIAVPKTLRDRRHDCPQCGFVASRDHNAALNILGLGESLAGTSSSKRLRAQTAK